MNQSYSTISTTSKSKSVHSLVRYNYLPRLIGFFVFGAVLASFFIENRNPFTWIGIISYSLLWPHIAYYIGAKGGKSKDLELVNFNIEAFLGGVWIVLVSFSPWPSFAIIIAGVLNSVVVGGFRLLARTLTVFGVGILFAGLIGGFRFEPQVGLLTIFCSFSFVLVYVVLASYSSFTSSKLLRESKKELKKAHEKLNAKYEITQQDLIEREKVEKELLKANEELKKFAYVVSHDLKSPLRGMSSLVHFIEQEPEDVLSEDSKKHFNLLKERINRLYNLINGILEFNKIGDGSKEMQDLNLKDIFSQVTKNLLIPAAFRLNIQPDLPTIRFNEAHLVEIYSNLISNSIRYNDKTKGTIELGYKDAGQFHELCIKDDGMGIPTKHHYRVFEMFQRLHSGDQIEGSGMGLSIVKKILDNYGGRIWIVKETSDGTEIKFRIPKDL